MIAISLFHLIVCVRLVQWKDLRVWGKMRFIGYKCKCSTQHTDTLNRLQRRRRKKKHSLPIYYLLPVLAFCLWTDLLMMLLIRPSQSAQHRQHPAYRYKYTGTLTEALRHYRADTLSYWSQAVMWLQDIMMMQRCLCYSHMWVLCLCACVLPLFVQHNFFFLCLCATSSNALKSYVSPAPLYYWDKSLSENQEPLGHWLFWAVSSPEQH